MKTIVSITLIFVAISISFVSTEVIGQNNSLAQVTALATKKAEIRFYKDHNGDDIDVVLPANLLKFPFPVLEERGEYIKIKQQDKLLWVKSINFKLTRSCSELAAKSQNDMNSNELTASRGAGGGKGCIQ